MKKYLPFILILIFFTQKSFAEIEIKTLKTLNFTSEDEIQIEFSQRGGEVVNSQNFKVKYHETEYLFVPVVGIQSIQSDNIPLCEIFILNKDADGEAYKLNKEVLIKCDKITSMYFFKSSVKDSSWFVFSSEYTTRKSGKVVTYWPLPYDTKKSKFVLNTNLQNFLTTNKASNLNDFKKYFKMFYSDVKNIDEIYFFDK
jgi:hypothetical protein